MADLTADRIVRFRYGWTHQRYSLAAVQVFKGSLLNLQAAGHADTAADTASEIFLGIAAEGVDNSAGAAGDLSVQVWVPDGANSQFLLTSSTGLTQANVGDVIFVDEDNDPTTSAGSNNVELGRMAELVSSTTAWFAVRRLGDSTS